MFITILKLFGISLIPVAFASLIHALKIYTKFDQLKKHYQYAIIITLFSISCILGTVFGVESEAGAIINVRDASPIISGLMFGGPVGVVVGFVGGLYRFVSVYWGGSGAYTQLACSISTFMAGVFTLLVRRFIFNNHHGKWYYGLFLGILCEDFHMLLVILTHLNDIQNAYSVVTDVVAPMFITNSLAVAIAIIIADCLYKEKFFEGGRPFKISTKVQLALICCLVAAYGAVSSVSYFGTKNVALRTNEKSLSISIDDLTNNVDNLVDEKMPTYTQYTLYFDAEKLEDDLSQTNVILTPQMITDKYDVTENDNGEFIGYFYNNETFDAISLSSDMFYTIVAKFSEKKELTISQAIVLSVMPAISEAVAKENHEEVKDKIHLGFRFAMLISLPCMAGLITLANPIMKLLYGLKTGGGDVLAILSLSLVFVMLGQLFAACLQGMGKFYLPIINLAIACIFKFILTFYLTGVEVLNINGAAIATVITYMIYALLNLFFVKKYADYHVKDKMNSIVKPIIATLVMTVLTMGAYYGLVFVGVEQRISTLLAVCVGGVTYVVMLLVTKILSKDDYESLPGGNKIYKILNKLHLA